MTKRSDDPNPEPPGGRAFERLKQFEQARKAAADKPKPPLPTSETDDSEKDQQ
jgi:hypothetical protein